MKSIMRHHSQNQQSRDVGRKRVARKITHHRGSRRQVISDPRKMHSHGFASGMRFELPEIAPRVVGARFTTWTV
jgi:hypothetical protein